MARYDDPQLGRWTQQDPVGGSLGNPRSSNRYVCTEDDPVNLTDARGTCTTLGTVALLGLAVVALLGIFVAVLAAPEAIFASFGAFVTALIGGSTIANFVGAASIVGAVGTFVFGGLAFADCVL